MDVHPLHIRLGQEIPPDKAGVIAYDPRFVPPPGPPIANLPLKKARIFPASDNASPRDLFTHHASEHTTIRCHNTAHRFVRRTDDREMLIYVDGSCLNQNDTSAVEIRRAGCAWIFKPAPYTARERGEDIRLETKGPTGREYPQTSNRAELRAAIGALYYRKWYGEGWQKLVIATDSEYVVLGITDRIERWASNGWRTAAGKAVKNKDLWKALLDRINDFAEHGTEVLFWRIPREQNAEADEAARNAALTKPAVQEYVVYQGTLV